MSVKLIAEALEIVKSKFIGKDYDTYLAELNQDLDAIFGSSVLTNIQASGHGVMLIELLADLAGIIAWAVDRQADEFSHETAIIRDNVVSIARYLGYKPFGAVPAVVALSVTIPVQTANLIIAAGTKLVGPGGLVFETIQETIFLVGETGPKTINAREGKSLEEIFNSDGAKGQVFRLESVPIGQSIADSTVTVRVGGVLWDTKRFLTFDQDDIYEVELGRQPPLVRFGDGIAGNVPENGAEIRVQYFITSGSDGAVLQDTVVSFQDQILAGVTPVSATITHPVSSPGSPRESLTSIKTNARLVWQAAERSVTKDDYTGLINSFVDPTFGAVAIGRATVPRSAAEDAQLQTFLAQLRALGTVPASIIDPIEEYFDKILSSPCEANVVLAQILGTDTLGRYVAASEDLARSLDTFLNGNKKEATVSVQVIDGTEKLLSLDLTGTLRTTDDVDSAAKQEDVRQNVIDATVTFLIGRSYGESFRVGDLYAILEAITGVRNIGVRVANQAARVDLFGDISLGEFEVFTMGLLPVIALEA